MQKLPLLVWARYVYVAALVLSLIGLIPVVWFPLQLGKLAVGVVLMLVAGILFVLGGGMTGIVGKRGFWSALLVGLLPLSYIVSYLLSTDRSLGLLGYAVETDTVCFVVVASIAFVLSFLMFRRLGSARVLLVGVSITAVVAMAFQFVSILFGTRVLSDIFSNTSVNLVGKWNDLGLLAGLVFILCLMWLQCYPLSIAKKIGLVCLGLITILFLALVQFPLIWGLLLGFSILFGVWAFMTSQKLGGGENKRVAAHLPWLSIGAAAISLFFLLWGAAVQGGLVKIFPVSSLEVRPSFSTTLDLVRASHGSSVERFVVGTGPQTFSNTWFMHKPVSLNQSQFWNLDFIVGYSTFATALGTVGLLGALAWIIPLVLVLIGLLRMMRERALFNPHEQVLLLALGFSSIYLWVSTFMYPPSGNLLLLAFALSGASFALSMKNDGAQDTEPQTKSEILTGRVVIIVLLVLLAICSFFIVRRYISETHVNQGFAAISKNDIVGALDKANAAMSVEKTSNALQFAVQAGGVAMQQIIQATSTPTAEVQQQFASLTQTTVNAGQLAVATTPNDYRAYFSLGKVYNLLASVGIQGASEQALKYYQLAAEHNPTNPEIALNQSRLYSSLGNVDKTAEALRQALTLKPDYTDAILFAVQLYVANKDLNNAILAARAAVNSAPGVPAIWFELGLLYYSANDMENAATAFRQAVQIQSDYANAKYFLGLAAAATGKNQEAIQQFRDLSATNPDNAEVKLILSNLEAGKPPFTGATPPVTSTPQTRTNAPISQ